MLTRANNYCVNGITIQDLIIRQMHKAAHFSKLWHEAMEDGDEVRDELYCRMMNYEQAEIWGLMNIQGFERDDDEFIMVSEYIVDAIALMK